VLVGTGIASIGVGAVTGILVLDRASTYRAHCDASGCDPDGMAAASSGKVLGIVSPVAFGAGLALGGVGTYLLLTPSHPTATARMRIGPMLGSRGIVVDAAF
jgi:hypothetical protein